MGLWVNYKVRFILFCFLCHGTQSSCVLHGLAHGSVGQLQGEVHFVLFPLSWDTVLLRPSWLSSWVCGSATRSGLFCFVSFVMGHSLFPLSWDTVLLCPSWLSSWVCGSATGSGLFCFVSFVMGHSLFPLSWDTVLLCPSWLSSWVCGSATRSGLFCFVCHGTQSSCVLHGLAHGSVGQLQGQACFVSFVMGHSPLVSFMA